MKIPIKILVSQRGGGIKDLRSARAACLQIIPRSAHLQGRPLLRFCNGGGDEEPSGERPLGSRREGDGSIKTGVLGMRVTSKPRFVNRLIKRLTTFGLLR